MKWIRPIVTIMCVLAVIYGFFVDKIETQAFLVIANTAILWWYKSRDEAKTKENGTPTP